MEQLLDDARYFMESETVESGARGREALFHERRLAMGAGAVWPLLLKLRHLDVDTDDREACFVALESYLVRRLIAGYQARSYDQVALELIEALSEQAQIPEGPSKAIRTHLLAYSENANLWPNDAVTIQAVSQRNLALYARRLVLAALERNLIPSMTGNQRVPAGLHVEHLLPQGWRPEEWPLPSGIDPEQAEEERNQALATLGNLPLLNARLNSSVSNRAWTVKREKIRQSDNLFLNRRLLEAIRVESGMSEQELVKELFRLDREGYIDFEHWQGALGRCRIGPQGIVIGLMHANYQEVETAYKEIAAYIYEAVGPEGNQISVGEILETTGHSSLLVNAVLDIWDNRDLIKIVRTLGGTASDTVWQVSPLLEEEAS